MESIVSNCYSFLLSMMSAYTLKGTGSISVGKTQQKYLNRLLLVMYFCTKIVKNIVRCINVALNAAGVETHATSLIL